MPETVPRGFNVHGIYWEELEETVEEGKRRWLDKLEIYALLCNPTRRLRTRRLNQRPASGTIEFFDGGKFDKFRQDGYKWNKECHEYLKLRRKPIIHVYYAKDSEGLNLSRKTYWRVNEHRSKVGDTVMVQYLEQPKENNSGFGTNVNNLDIYSYLDNASWTDLLQSNDSSHQTAPRRGEVLVGNQSNGTAVRTWGNDDGVSALSQWDPISGDANDFLDAPVNDRWM